MWSFTSSSDVRPDKPRRYTWLSMVPRTTYSGSGTRTATLSKLVEFCLVGHEGVAPKTESARFAEQNQTEALDVNHQREFPNVCPRGRNARIS